MAGFSDRIRDVFNPVPTPTARFGAPGMGGDDENYLGSALSQMEPYFHKIRNRDLADREAMAMQDRRFAELPPPGMNRMQSMFAGGPPNSRIELRRGMNPANQPGMDVRYDPTPEIASQQMKLRNRQLDLEDTRASRGMDLKAGEINLDREYKEKGHKLDRDRLELDTLKNKQIYDVKTKELETKAADAERRLKIAEETARNRADNASAQLALRQAQLEAQNARHAAELARRDSAQAETTRMNDARINQMMEEARRAGVQYEEVTDEKGNKSFKVTRRGEQGGDTVQMKGPDGKTYPVPKDKVEQAKKDGMRPIG